MRPRAFFDDGLFFMSFSIALGVIALIIPARGAALEGALRARPDLPAAPVAARAVSASTGMSDTEQRLLTGAAGGADERGCGS